MDEVRYITYSKEEENIVKSGSSAIREVLLGTETNKKLSLLFCLDKFLDTWYGYDLPYRDEIIELLQMVIITSEEKEVIEDALNLLSSYAWGPFPILEKGLKDISDEEMQSAASYVVNMHRMALVEELLNAECLRLFNEANPRNESGQHSFCEDAIIVCSSLINPEVTKYPEKDCDALFQIKDGKVIPIGIPITGIPYARKHPSERRFKRAEFYYGIDFEKMECCLIYIFAPLWAGCLVYSLVCDGEQNYSLGDSRLVWIS